MPAWPGPPLPYPAPARTRKPPRSRRSRRAAPPPRRQRGRAAGRPPPTAPSRGQAGTRGIVCPALRASARWPGLVEMQAAHLN